MSFPQAILSPSAITLSGLSQNTWGTVTVSGMPAGCTGMIALVEGSGATYVRETRAFTSTDSYVSDTLLTGTQTFRWVPLDSSGRFSYYSGSTTPNSDVIFPIAWLGPEWTFLTNIKAMSTLTTSFASYSTSGYAPGATAAVFAIHGASSQSAYFRHPSGSDNFTNGNESGGRMDFFTPLDGGQNYGAKGGAGQQPYLVAYCTAGFTEASPSTHNAVDRTPATTGSYQNLSDSGDTNPVVLLYWINNTGGTVESFQLSEQGTAWSAPNAQPGSRFAGFVAAGAPAQANIATTTTLFKELGYLAVPLASVRNGVLTMVGVGS